MSHNELGGSFMRLYQAAYGAGQGAGKPSLGILIAGYSANQGLPEAWLIRINEGECPPPALVQPQAQVRCFWDGQPEAIHRVLFGYGTGLRDTLQNLGVGPLLLDGVMNHITNALLVSPDHPADADSGCDRPGRVLCLFDDHVFSLQPWCSSVGGPIGLRRSQSTEGYKWIKRKHYYEPRSTLATESAMTFNFNTAGQRVVPNQAEPQGIQPLFYGFQPVVVTGGKQGLQLDAKSFCRSFNCHRS